MIDNKKLYAIFIPAILLVAFALAIRIIQYEPLFPKKSEASALSNQEMIPILPGDPVLGNKKASQTIVVFEDFSCEGCREQNMLLEELLQKYPKQVKIIWKGLPVKTYPIPSTPAHKYSYCANQQGKFKEFKNLAFNNYNQLTEDVLKLIAEKIDLNERKLNSCLNSEDPQNHIRATEQLGMLFNIQAVPTVFYNNKQIEGPTTIFGWEFLLDLENE